MVLIEIVQTKNPPLNKEAKTNQWKILRGTESLRHYKITVAPFFQVITFSAQSFPYLGDYGYIS